MKRICSQQIQNKTKTTVKDSDDPLGILKNISAKQIKAEEIGSLIESSFTSTRSSGEQTYPDYYGGLYINDKKEVVVLIKGDPIQYCQILMGKTKNNEFKIQQCSYSFKELQDVVELMNQKFMNNKELIHETGVDAYGIRTDENKIIVELSNCTENDIKTFRTKIIDSPMLTFKKTKGNYEMLSTTFNPGEGISSGGYTSSIGYRVKKNGLKCIVSAGHGIQNVGQNISYGSTTCGKCLGTHIGENIDAAYCSLNSGYEASNKTQFSKVTLNPTVEVLPLGYQAHMDGIFSGHKYGEVTKVDKAIHFKVNNIDYIFTNMTEVTLLAKEGDSGGVVFTVKKNVAGIVQSGNKEEGHMYYVKADLINNYYGLTMY